MKIQLGNFEWEGDGEGLAFVFLASLLIIAAVILGVVVTIYKVQP